MSTILPADPAAFTRCGHARARLGGAMPTLLDLLGPPARCSRCWPTFADSILVISVWGDDGARAVRPMMTSASPGRDGGDGDRAGRAQRATGSSTTIAKFCSTDSGQVYGVCSLWNFRLEFSA